MFNDIEYLILMKKRFSVCFFKAYVSLEKKWNFKFLDGYINFEWNAINEDLFINFSSKFSEEDKEYFGEDKVAFSFCYPFLEKIV